jgi:hypothetical protein
MSAHRGLDWHNSARIRRREDDVRMVVSGIGCGLGKYSIPVGWRARPDLILGVIGLVGRVSLVPFEQG